MHAKLRTELALFPPASPLVAVPLPSSQYSVELTNTSVGRLVVERTRVIGLDYGHTELHLIDSNTPIDHNVSADIYVVKPHHLGKWAHASHHLSEICTYVHA